MATQHHEEDVHEGTPGYKLSQPKQSLATYQQMDCSFPGKQGQHCGRQPQHPAVQHIVTPALTPALTTVSQPPVLTAHQPCCLRSTWHLTCFSLPTYTNRSHVFHEGPEPFRVHPCAGTATVVAVADAEELLRLLCSKTNTTIPVSGLAVPTPADPASAPARTDEKEDENNGGKENEENEADETTTMLTVPGHNGGVADGSSSGRVWCGARQQHVALPVPAAAVSLPPSRPRPGCAPTDAGDESLQRYKESLGLGGGKHLSDPTDPRVCIIQSLTLETPGRDPVTIDLSVPGTEATLKDHPFTIKEGSRFTMVATFKVQHEVLSGLRYVQVVKRKGVRVGKDSEMLGSYAPNTDKQPLYTKRFQEDEAPSGMLARGHYVALSTFVDDDKKTHLSFEWSFDIAKDW